MPAPSGHHLVDLEQQLAGLLVQFDFLSEAWPMAPRAVDRASIGRVHSQALDEIGSLQHRITDRETCGGFGLLDERFLVGNICTIATFAHIFIPPPDEFRLVLHLLLNGGLNRNAPPGIGGTAQQALPGHLGSGRGGRTFPI